VRAVKGIKADILCLIMVMAFLAGLCSSFVPAYAAGPVVAVANTATGSNVTLAGLNDKFSISISIDNGPSNLGGYEYRLVWNASILNCTSYTNTPPQEWGDNVFKGRDELNRTNPDGTQSYWTVITATLFGVSVAPNHVVNTFNFTVVGTGETTIEIGNPILGDQYGNSVPCIAVSGIFKTLVKNASVVDVRPWSNKILQNASTNVNVTVLNEGNTPASFSVFTYYNSSNGYVGLIGQQDVTDLSGNAYQNLTFHWNTNGIALGVYVIFANVTGGKGHTEFIGGTIEVQNQINNDIALIELTSNATGLVEPETAALTIGVQNQGNVNEYNCTLRLYDNGSLTEGYQTTISEILPGEVSNHLYVWNTVNRTGNSFFVANISLNTGETDSNPANNQRNLTLTVSESPPEARFTVSPDKPSALQDVTFDASSSTDPLGTIANYTWDFGDLTYFEYGVVVKHVYTAPGNYSVRLTIRDTKGLGYDVNRPVTSTCLAQKNITVGRAAPPVISDTMLSYVAIAIIIVEIVGLMVVVRRRLKISS
jgi:PKD repeat protein